MPALPQSKPTGDSPHDLPPDPNQGQNATPSTSSAAIQPAPAVINATSHARVHVFPRRFLGPMPLGVATSSKAEEKRQVLRQLRRNTMRGLLGEDELGVDDAHGAGARRQARRVVHRFRVRKRSNLGDETETDYEVGDTSSGSSSSSEDDPQPTPKKKKKGKDKKAGKKGKGKKKGKKKRKAKKGPADTWVGNSFDIGCEFDSVPDKETPDPAQDDSADEDNPPTPASVLGRDVQDSPKLVDEPLLGQDVQDSPDQLAGEAEREEPSTPTTAGPSTRRASSTRSTGADTFVTARGSLSGSDAESTFEADVPHPPPPLSDVPTSLASSPRAAASSQGDSRARLIHSSDDEADLGESRLSPRGSASVSSKPRRSINSASVASMGRNAKDAFNTRLKSALRPTESHAYNDMEQPARGKTVQFHHSPDAIISRPSGAQVPAHPNDVLARSGSNAEGTSHDAVEDATVIDDDVLPGGVVMRDRVVVKVGRHRDEGIRIFDETEQRRSPCYRIDPMEEYILGMTVTSIDFYLDWVSCAMSGQADKQSWPLQERIKGHKRLRYSVPLSAPTTLSVFNTTDMTLALVCPWSTIVRNTARNTARHMDKSLRRQTSVWDRARHSRVADGLHMGRQGSAIFLITFGERSRALDWHWYIAGQIGLRLPRSIDIRVPVLEQTLRLAVPEEPSSTTFNSSAILRTVWKALLSNTEQTRLLRELGRLPKLELAWKETAPNLDWVCWNSTVTDRPREWALLASFAQGLAGGKKSTLQVRDATHHGVKVRLQDGTMLDEPPGIEGYVIRHKSDVAPKEEVYLCIADGHCFISSASGATPPLLPRRKGSSPAELFPQLHERFLDGERRRLASFVEQSAGCIDLSRVATIKLRKSTELTGGLDEPPMAPHETNFTIQQDDSPPSPDTRPRSKSNTVTEADRQTAPLQIPSPPARAKTFHTPAPTQPKKRSSALTPLPKEGKKAEREFEVSLRAGHVVVFEARTPAIAAEWVAGLTELVRYWTLRRRVDARSAMDVVQLHMGREAFVGQALDVSTETLLNQLWNWCVIDGCRPVTFSGRVYVRRSKWGKFR